MSASEQIARQFANAAANKNTWSTILYNVKAYGAIGDGVADDTEKIQAAISSMTDGGILYFPNGNYVTTGITIDKIIIVEGDFTLTAKNTDQDYVLNITSRVKTIGKMVISGGGKALIGILGEDFGRSDFDNIEITDCKIWGMQYGPTGNNNSVTVHKSRFTTNGKKHTTTFTQSSHSGAGTALEAVVTLNNPIDDYANTDNSIYFIIYNGRAYRVEDIVSTSQLSVGLMDIGDANTGTMDVIVGGGLDIAQYGDNGVGILNNIVTSNNAGIGLHISSLYGHQINTFSAEGNSIGFATYSLTIGLVMIKPYFEVNDIDIAIYQYIKGTIINPVIDISGIQFVLNYLIGGYDYSEYLVIFSNEYTIPNFNSTILPFRDPSTSTRDIMPGKTYGFWSTSSRSINFRILNNESYTITFNNFIEINLIAAGDTVSLTLFDDSEETIMGGSSYSFVASGACVVKILKTANYADWRVNVFQSGYETSISNTPSYVGQEALVSGVWYKAIGTSSASDWVALN